MPMRSATLANQLAKVRLSKTLPGIGTSTELCTQAGQALNVAVEVFPTPNPNFRRVDVSVLEGGIQVVRVTSIVGRN